MQGPYSVHVLQLFSPNLSLIKIYNGNKIIYLAAWILGFSGASVVKNPFANAGDAGDRGSTLEEEIATL